MQNKLQTIIEASDRASSLIRQILDFSQKTVQRKKRIDLFLFLKELIRFLRQTIPETIRISLNGEPGQYWVEADSTQLHQLFTNLAINARDAMPVGGQLIINLSQLKEATAQAISVENNQDLTGNWFCIEVIDTGSGISPKHIPRIFEPFFTTKEIGHGVGLGLAQVYGIVNQHAGHIAVASTVGEGTTITVYLPPASKQDEKVVEKPPPMVFSEGRETILLVEDEPNVLKTSKAVLEHLQYQVITATNGQEALAVYRKYKAEIALILSDMVMPDMTGEALFRAMKAQNPDVKMIMVSGYPLDNKGIQLIEQGLVAWLQKPISLRKLSQILSKVL